MTSMFPSLSLIISVSLSQLSHAAVSALCRSIKLQCELYSSRQIAICLDPYCGLGFVLWCLARYWPIINHKNNAPPTQGDGGEGGGGSLLTHVVWCRLFVSSVYSGHQSVLIPPFELESCLSLWLSTLTQYRIRDTFCSYSVMELCTKGLGTQTDMLKVRTGASLRMFQSKRSW